MFFLFLGLVAVALSDSCVCDQTETPCIPSISQLGLTLNLFTGEQTQYGFSVLNFTCSGKTYLDSVTGKTFQIYDEMVVQPSPYGEVTSSNFMTSESFAKSLTTQVHADGKYEFFQASADVAFIDSTLVQENEFYIVTEQLLRIYDYKLTMPLPLLTASPEFNKIVDTYLTDEYDQDTYFKAIDTILGTHAIVSMAVGGIGAAHTEISYEYLQKKTTTDASLDAKIYFVNLQGSVTHNSTSEAWQNYTKTSTMVLGGDPEYAGFCTWNQWLPTVRQQPVRITYNVEPIQNLIPNSSPKSVNYARAISEYSDSLKPTTVPNCTHFDIGSSSPPHTVLKIGQLDSSHTLFLVEGPDDRDRCLSALAFGNFDSSHDPTLIVREVVRSSSVDVAGYIWRSDFGSGSVDVNSNLGSCSGSGNLRTSGNRFTCSSRDQVQQGDTVPELGIVFKAGGCVSWLGCDSAGWAAIWQPRVISSSLAIRK